MEAEDICVCGGGGGLVGGLGGLACSCGIAGYGLKIRLRWDTISSLMNLYQPKLFSISTQTFFTWYLTGGVWSSYHGGKTVQNISNQGAMWGTLGGLW